MTPKERAEQWKRVYEDGGDEALGKAISEFGNTNPVECIETIEASFIADGDDEGLEEFQAEISRECRRAIEEQLTQDGLAFFDELIRMARENGMDDVADSFEAHSRRFRN